MVTAWKRIIFPPKFWIFWVTSISFYNSFSFLVYLKLSLEMKIIIIQNLHYIIISILLKI
jgi:hypothetical protein